MSDVIEAPATGSRLMQDMLLHYEIQHFLAEEAAMLDERRFREWFALLADDLIYWMPVRTTTAKGDEANEFSKYGEGAFFDEDKTLMEERIRKLETSYSWSEDPPSRTRHMLSNIRVRERLSETEYRVSSDFMVYRSRLARDEDLWVGRREDVLRRVATGWQIARRDIFIDQVSLNSKNISIFF